MYSYQCDTCEYYLNPDEEGQCEKCRQNKSKRIRMTAIGSDRQEEENERD